MPTLHSLAISLPLTLTTMLGIIANILALIYFLRNERRGLPNKLRLMLIISDIFFLLGTHFMSICTISGTINYCREYFLPILVLTTLEAGLITSCIAVTNAIAVAFPFYTINAMRTYQGTCTLTIVNGLQVLPYLFKDDNDIGYILIINSIQLATEVTIIVISAGLIIFRLRQSNAENGVSNLEERKQQNTYIIKTILMKCITFAVTTILGAIACLIYFYFPGNNTLFTFQGFLLSLSSVINALLHITRSPGLRNYTAHILLQHPSQS